MRPTTQHLTQVFKESFTFRILGTFERILIKGMKPIQFEFSERETTGLLLTIGIQLYTGKEWWERVCPPERALSPITPQPQLKIAQIVN